MKTLSIPQPVSCLTAIGQVVSRNAAVWTLVDEFHSSCGATDDLLAAAAECNPVTMGEALFLIIVAHNFAHRVEGSGDQEYNQRAIEKVRSALHSVANFMSAQGVKSDPLVREYFMPPCNDPRVQGKEREAFLSGDRTEDLARDVFAKLASRKNGGRS
jgi:hypothetical protein